jgi:hypothetical protein
MLRGRALWESKRSAATSAQSGRSDAAAFVGFPAGEVPGRPLRRHPWTVRRQRVAGRVSLDRFQPLPLVCHKVSPSRIIHGTAADGLNWAEVPRIYTSTPIAIRIGAKLEFSERIYAGRHCIEWTGFCNKRGYGVLQQRIGPRSKGKTRQIYVHRWHFEYLFGPLPGDLEFDHLCRNHACANPHHLEAVTHAETIRRGNRGKHNESLPQ